MFEIKNQPYKILRGVKEFHEKCEEDVRERVEEFLEENLGFFVSLQECTDEGYFRIYMHTDNYEELTQEELDKLCDLGITDCPSSTDKILSVANVHYIKRLTIGGKKNDR